MLLTADRTGERADAALARLCPELTRSAAQKLLEEGRVVCCGKALKKNDRLTEGDCLAVTLPEVQETSIEPENIPLDIVYEDGDVIVINKPKGMVVHPAAGHWSGTLVNALMYHCRDSLSGINGELRPGIVHRIDMDTSGLLIVAKNDFAHQALAEQLKDHSLARTYECIVVGGMKEDSGTIDAPIGRHPTDRKKMAVTEKNSREAITHWQVLERLYPSAMQAGDGTHPPDSGAPGLSGPSHCRRHGLRPEKAGVGPGQPVPPCPGADLPPSPDRAAHDRLLSAAALL